jgi:hypothetical protein
MIITAGRFKRPFKTSLPGGYLRLFTGEGPQVKGKQHQDQYVERNPKDHRCFHENQFECKNSYLELVRRGSPEL